MAKIEEFPLEQTTVQIEEFPIESQGQNKTTIQEFPLESYKIEEFPSVEQQEDTVIKQEAEKFTLRGAAEQFATGALNEALLGFPLFSIEKSSPIGKDIIKEMESTNKAERIARGLGSFSGFVAGLPAKVFNKGAQLFTKSRVIQKGLKTLVSAKKVRRLVQAAGAGASSFGLYEILKAPEEDFSEKTKSVPLQAVIGGILGIAGQAIRGPLSKKRFKNFAKGDKDLIGVVDDIRGKDIINNNAFTSAETVLSRQGNSGAELAARMRQAEENSLFKFGQTLEDFGFKKKFNKLSKNELANITDVLEGKAVSLNDKVDDVVNWFRSIEQGVVKEAQGMGVKSKNLSGELSDFIGRKNYFPHQIIDTNASGNVVKETLQAAVKRGEYKNIGEAKTDWIGFKAFIEGKGRDKRFLKELVKKGKAENVEQARELVSNFMNKNKTRRFGSLEFSRELDLPFWDPNPKRVIPKFIKGANNRLEEIRLLGQNNEIAKKLISDIGESGLDQSTARDIFKAWSGTEDVKDAFGFIGPKASQALRNFQVVSKLGLAPVANASQSTLTAIKTGVGNTAKAIGQSFTKGGQEFANRTGAVLDSSLEQLMRESAGSGGVGSKFLKAIGFTATEKFNRVVAANAGKNYVKQMANKLLKNPSDRLARRALSELRINPETVIKNGGLLFDDLLKAGSGIVRKTQFKSGVLDLPLFFNSPEGKILTQFKTFAFNHTKFIKEAILEETARGNFEPMIRAIALMPVVGEGVGDVRAVLTGRKRDKKGLERIAENMANVGGLGILTDIWNSARYKNLAGFFTGPTFSTLSEFGQGAVQAAEGNADPLVKSTLRQVPVAGPLLKNLLKRRKG